MIRERVVVCPVVGDGCLGLFLFHWLVLGETFPGRRSMDNEGRSAILPQPRNLDQMGKPIPGYCQDG